MKIGKLAQADIALCRLHVAYILCQSWLTDKGDNQSDVQPSWECVSHWRSQLQSSDRYKQCDGTPTLGPVNEGPKLEAHICAGRLNVRLWRMFRPPALWRRTPVAWAT